MNIGELFHYYYFDFAGNEESSRSIAFFDLFWWIKLKEDDVSPLTSAQRTYEKFFASAQNDGGPIPSNDALDGGQNPSTNAEDSELPSNQFGRGQPVSSISSGWKPKPWKLLGGSGKNSRKGPTTKTQGSQDGNFFFKYRIQKSTS